MDDAVRAAFAAVPRAGFLPRTERSRADFDGPIPIGHGQTNSQPRTVADMLRLLDVRPGQRVLDVGSGSGWTTALLAPPRRARRARSLGVELEPELAALGRREPLRRAGCRGPRSAAPPGACSARPQRGPWDRILVSAEASRCRRPSSTSSPTRDGSSCPLPAR